MMADDPMTPLSLKEICERCAVGKDVIVKLVEFGVAEPDQSEESGWVFSVSAYLRIRRALRLKRDLDINEPGIALALELLDEIQEMRAELARLRGEN